ncbi:hypothetical protein VTL71DRAFT_15493 [Oculimacula yallundae]|uniref:Uncharacterized protein n=1 Tax=Oculimacula yallundae TaxID=86028 RepID=A0ABR4CGS6_9HELO
MKKIPIVRKENHASRFKPGASSKSVPQISEHASLQTLPTELRQQIYGLIFIDHSRGCTCYLPEFRHCRIYRRARGLSQTSRFFYSETRHLYYKCARFAFNSPLACNNFLNIIGSHVEYIGHLKVLFKWQEIPLLRTLFNKYQLVSGLHTLLLECTSKPVETELKRIYMPSVQAANPNIMYDIRLRPERHPLSSLNSLQSLTVEGHVESEEIMEAIVKLSLKIEASARKEEREVIKTERTRLRAKSVLLFRIEKT